MMSPSLFGEGIGGLLVACAVLNIGCGATPTQPTSANAATSQSTSSAEATSGQPAVVAQVVAANLNPTDLTSRGWSCRPAPPPIQALTGCSHPNQGFPSFDTAPEDRPAAFTLLMFDGAGNFIGTLILLRTDLYHGQVCESTGEPYLSRPLIGYSECLHTAGH